MTRYVLAAVAAGCVAAAASAQPITGVPGPGCTNCGGAGAAPIYPQAAGAEAGYGYAMPAAGTGGRCKDCDPRFGLAPFFRKLAFWKKDGGTCRTCGRGLGGRGCAGGNCAGQPFGGGGHGWGHKNAGPAVNPYPDGVPGTLVYPYNPYIRSPRDWFMQDK